MPEISIAAEQIFHIGSFPVTNSFLFSCLVVALFAVGSYLIRPKFALVPNKAQGIIELAIEEILKLMDAVLGDRRKSMRYLPLVGTIFFFILISNWLGLFPGVGPIGIKEKGHLVPLLRAPAADLNFTIAIAAIAVFSVNFFGVGVLGFKKHFSKFFTIKNPIFSFAGILEFISEFIKIVSFSFRLFGNIFAGEVLLTIVGFLIPYFIPLPFLFLEVFVGFIQAFIFSMLTLVFIAMATSEEPAH